MSTHGAVGTLVGDKFEGRYVHSDGYPTHTGLAVAQIIARDGLDKALDELVKAPRDWYLLVPGLPELTDEIRARLPEFRTGPHTDDPARYWSYLKEGDGHLSEVGVPGYGLAEATRSEHWVQLTAEANNDHEWDVRWAYGIDREHGHLVVLHAVHGLGHCVTDRLPLDELPLEREAWQPIYDNCELLCGKGAE